jgi:pimeloyl-ACP methyl ester carboxylesterase
MTHIRLPFAVSLFASLLIVTAAAKESTLPPLSIAQQGYFFVDGKYSTVNDRQVMTGQLYVEFQIPGKQTHPWPVVMVHGLGQTGSNFTGTPDGREGWAQFFLRQGYGVYIIDQPGRGKAAYDADRYGPLAPPDLENVLRRFVAPERYNLWPQAHLHTQWPGRGVAGDPVFDQFYASQVPSIQDLTLQISLTSNALVALLDKIGPAIVMTHSQSGAFGWPVADARPDKVKALLAIEPSGPPFFNVDNVPAPELFRDGTPQARPWGLTAIPITYSPAAKDPADLAVVRQDAPDAPDLARCWMQKAPARRLPNLQKMPILVMTAEASYHAAYDHCTVKFLQQAGVEPTWIKLGEAGIHGNGHMVMLEKNNTEIAELMSRWLAKVVPPSGRKKN